MFMDSVTSAVKMCIYSETVYIVTERKELDTSHRIDGASSTAYGDQADQLPGSFFQLHNTQFT